MINEIGMVYYFKGNESILRIKVKITKEDELIVLKCQIFVCNLFRPGMRLIFI